MESMVFTPWSKKVIPFCSPRHMMQAYQDDKRKETVLPWNNGNLFQFSAPHMMSGNPRKRAPGKIRTRWLSKSKYNPMKVRRPSTSETKMTDLDAIDSNNMALSPAKVCNRFGLSCSLCKQGDPHIPHLKSQIGHKDRDKERDWGD